MNDFKVNFYQGPFCGQSVAPPFWCLSIVLGTVTLKLLLERQNAMKSLDTKGDRKFHALSKHGICFLATFFQSRENIEKLGESDCWNSVSENGMRKMSSLHLIFCLKKPVKNKILIQRMLENFTGFQNITLLFIKIMILMQISLKYILQFFPGVDI